MQNQKFEIGQRVRVREAASSVHCLDPSWCLRCGVVVRTKDYDGKVWAFVRFDGDTWDSSFPLCLLEPEPGTLDRSIFDSRAGWTHACSVPDSWKGRRIEWRRTSDPDGTIHSDTLYSMDWRVEGSDVECRLLNKGPAFGVGQRVRADRYGSGFVTRLDEQCDRDAMWHLVSLEAGGWPRWFKGEELTAVEPTVMPVPAEPTYQCKTCKDSGTVLGEDALDDYPTLCMDCRGEVWDAEWRIQRGPPTAPERQSVIWDAIRWPSRRSGPETMPFETFFRWSGCLGGADLGGDYTVAVNMRTDEEICRVEGELCHEMVADRVLASLRAASQ